ncbi:hypothetical protein [Streptomyces sp. NPDC056669]|uniref:hypothetical protein n=1 Tax=Streptomyces sp. NPDC056669 TaxID=3345903 RepID=UPI0036CAB49F
MSNPLSPSFTSLLGRLDTDGDSAVVASLAAVPAGDGLWRVVYGSVLIGPAQMAAVCWLDWRADNGDGWALQHRHALAHSGVELGQYSRFTTIDGDWLLARVPLTSAGGPHERAGQWMEQLVTTGVRVNDAQGMEHIVRAELAPADTLALASRWMRAGLHQLTQAAARPVHGYRFPVVNLPAPLPDLPDVWPAGSRHLATPLSTLTGFTAHNGQAPTPAVAVARLRRTAWFSDVRVDALVHADIVLDSGRTSPASLEVDLEEFTDDGLVQARRLRLSDLALSSQTAERITVVLPTLGAGLRRQLRLYDRGGRLLDSLDASYFVERVVVTASTPEGLTTTTSVGSSPAIVDAVTRLSSLDVAEAEYTRMLEEGLAHRIADDPATARDILRDLLEQARGQLLVLDPYFGHKVDDWEVLRRASVPVRVLTAHKKRGQRITPVASPAANLYAHLPSLTIRSWDPGTQKVPWHDRVYIWEQGGLSVGTSPSGLGRRQARIDHISPTEAAAWYVRFNCWWNDIHSAHVL